MSIERQFRIEPGAGCLLHSRTLLAIDSYLNKNKQSWGFKAHTATTSALSTCPPSRIFELAFKLNPFHFQRVQNVCTTDDNIPKLCLMITCRESKGNMSASPCLIGTRCEKLRNCVCNSGCKTVKKCRRKTFRRLNRAQYFFGEISGRFSNFLLHFSFWN